MERIGLTFHDSINYWKKKKSFIISSITYQLIFLFNEKEDLKKKRKWDISRLNDKCFGFSAMFFDAYVASCVNIISCTYMKKLKYISFFQLFFFLLYILKITVNWCRHFTLNRETFQWFLLNDNTPQSVKRI